MLVCYGGGICVLGFCAVGATGQSAAGQRASGQGGGGKSKAVRIGFLVDSLEVERWQRDGEALQKRAKELGAKVVVKNGNGDDERQLKQARELIDSGAKALIVVAHDTDKAARIVALAKSKKVAVICYERLIPDSDVDFYAGPNTIHIGELQAAAMVKLAPKGNYILVKGRRWTITRNCCMWGICER